MKQFRFRLERVRRLRERVLEQRQVAHAEAKAFQQRVESQIAQVTTVREQEKSVLRESVANARIDAVIQSRSYDGVLRKLLQQLDVQLGQIERVVEGRRVELVGAQRDVKVLENLEDRQMERYQFAERRQEQQSLDEVGLQAFARQILDRSA